MIIDRIKFKNPFARKKMEWQVKQRDKHINDLKIIAVTGSVGKTISGFLLYHLLNKGGKRAAFIGTNGVWKQGKKLNSDFVINVASAGELNKELIDLANSDTEIVVLEAPPIAIAKQMFLGMSFDSLILTNIAGGEFAAGFESEQDYAETIFSLIHQVAHEGMAVLNGDDDSADWLIQSSDAIEQDIYAAWVKKAEVEDLKMDLNGTSFRYLGGFFQSKSITENYLQNVLQAIRLATKYVGLDSIDKALNSFLGLSGREQIIQKQPFSVMIDYAYQPPVVDSLLKSIRQVLGEESKIITVVGAAGMRGDSRKEVGAAAAKHSDYIFLTPQDPRGEDVAGINTQIAEFAERFRGVITERFYDMTEFESVSTAALKDKMNRVIGNGDVPIISFDSNSPGGRYNAIELAFDMADSGDMVVILGKGDDEVMDFGDTLFEWSDERAVLDIIESRNSQSNSNLSVSL